MTLAMRMEAQQIDTEPASDPADRLRLTIGLAKQDGRVARHLRAPLIPKSRLTMEGARR